MDDKMTVEITGFDAEKHAEDAAKRATAYRDAYSSRIYCV